MLTFRQKFFLSYLVVFLFFAILLYPLTTTLVNYIHHKNLVKRVEKLINELKHTPSIEKLIKKLKEKEEFVFFRVTLYDPTQGYLFDSHVDLLHPESYVSSEQMANDIQEALIKGSSYEVRFSPLFLEQMAYVAQSFPFEGRILVLRAAFPNGQIQTLSRDLNVTFIGFVLLLLLLFSFFAWFILHQLTKPAYQILEAIRPYQEGKANEIAQIQIDNQVSEFGQLAETLNSLSKRLRHQIDVLTHEKNEKTTILESLVEGVIAVDANSIMIYMNRMAELFLDIDQHDCIGKPFSILGYASCEALLNDALKTNEPLTSVLKLGRKKSRVFDLVATRLSDQAGAILVLQDKTSLHRVIEMGRDFVANASHELKTPITIIRGFAETLHDHPELSTEMMVDITKKILGNCTRMETLVKNLLTLAALDEGLPDSRLKKVDVLDLIDQAKHMIQTIHPKAKINIAVEGEPPFIQRLDQDLFLQALLNLLDNGVKYSKSPAHVTIRVVKLDKQLQVKIEDRGIGIPKEDLDRIFERFYAVDKSHSRLLGGSGLGLSIVEQIVEKHRGKIDVYSELNKGSTFIITLYDLPHAAESRGGS